MDNLDMRLRVYSTSIRGVSILHKEVMTMKHVRILVKGYLIILLPPAIAGAVVLYRWCL